ncbi:maleylacetate reductase [uncultured Tateyamaria sp.]|uniref:maleylacetate reductase n=1 Tax=uncultured Tateyamaria sp. TaxID=455651 RepID=UPI0026081FF6|nr:maleylacetate reductase [uncultured Tateyamaria sp.]
MQAFTYEPQKSRVIFGSGTVAAIPEEAGRLGLKRLLVLSTPEQADQAETVAKSAGQLVAGIFSKAAMHTPTEVTENAMEVMKSLKADGILAIGGGSTIGLGKALSVRTGKHQIAIPTSYAGSEMTPILGETANGKKVTRRDPRILPASVIYDVDLTLSLPWPMTVTSAMNAMAHAVEALYAKDRNPVVEVLAERGIAAFGQALRTLKTTPDDLAARSDAFFGAWACGTCLGQVSMALHHKLCHVLGGSFNLPHAATHTVILPHAAAFNGSDGRLAAVNRALGGTQPGQALYDLARELDAPLALSALGFADADVPRATDIVMENPYWNPRSFDAEDITSILSRALHGDRPER